MKKRYTFSTGETIEADLEDLKRLLAEYTQKVNELRLRFREIINI